MVMLSPYYSAPSNTFAIFYDDLGQSIPDPGLVRLGTVDSSTDRIAEAGNRLMVQMSLADHARFSYVDCGVPWRAVARSLGRPACS